MNVIDEVHTMLAALAGALDEPAIALDGENACTVEIEGFSFSFFYQPEPPALFIQAGLGQMDAAGLEKLLRLNHLWGGTGGGIFGVHPDDSQVYLTYRLDFPLPEGAYPELLCDLLPMLVGALEAATDTGGEAVPAQSPAENGLRV